ncbi:redoxin domain-containing protein [Methanolobus halotolerans]|uniref:Peroxiredoxin n=1 Tax=Methanolobus halotolerans TaxID=2052935 RepID=A0A4E0PYE4_9EURY|nr:redoxin domain-containing protein [Methanolobus halotolerans]TGC10549.1 peroxiredoxin [Methanolobus halotolerans]
MPLIGDDAPSFRARTTLGVVDFPEDYKGKWVIFFSHPGDFTPVCTTEFIRFATMQQEFRELNAELLGLSVDSNQSHIAWLEAIREKIEYKDLKNIDVMFPVIEDMSLEVARNYGMIHPHSNNTPEELLERFERSGGKLSLQQFSTETIRATFIIDPQAKIRAMLYYPFSNGRNIYEIKRLLQAIQKFDNDHVYTPENWHPGEDVIVPNPSTWVETKERQERVKESDSCKPWFLCMKKDKQE